MTTMDGVRGWRIGGRLAQRVQGLVEARVCLSPVSLSCLHAKFHTRHSPAICCWSSRPVWSLVGQDTNTDCHNKRYHNCKKFTFFGKAW